jgi:hypothetical protein
MSSPLNILGDSLAAVDLTLPPSATARWSPRRKAAVVLAARSGIISREEAYRRYQLSPEELAAWEAALDQNGVPGLRSTRQQIYRRTGRGSGGSGAENGVSRTAEP